MSGFFCAKCRITEQVEGVGATLAIIATYLGVKKWALFILYINFGLG